MTELGQRERRAFWIAVLVVVAAVFALAVWLLSPRFELDTPSLVDDWAMITRSGGDVAELLRLRNPEETRFVPSLAFWSYVQWHTFDAPDGLVGPNAWNLLRVFTLVAGLSLLTAVALPRPRGVGSAVLLATLAGIPAFAVVTVPKFARDLARFGPQEPFLVGALALAGALLAIAARSLLTPRPVAGRVVAFAILGSAVWIFGAYHKETSVCAVPLLAAALLAGRDRIRDWSLLSRDRKLALGALAAVVALPLVHVAIAGLRLAARGDLIYGAEVEGGGDLWTGFVNLYEWAHEPLSETARLFMWSAIALTALAIVVRRRMHWFAVGALVTGVATLAFAGQSGVLATRYYIPAYALFAVAFAVSLARLPPAAQAAGVLGVVLAFTPVAETRTEVQRWTDEELAGAAVARQVAALEESGCTIAMAGVDPETTVALPVVVRMQDGAAPASCRGAAAYFLLGPDGASTPLYSACAEGALETVVQGPLVSLHRCGRLGEGAERLLALHRFDSARV